MSPSFHHRSWFPFVIVGLTLTLTLFVVWAFLLRRNSPLADYENAPVVSLFSYQESVAAVTKDFWFQYDSQTDEAGRLIFVSEVEERILALRVPAEGRAVHFELVSALELLRQGLLGEEEKLIEGKERLQRAASENSWLTF